LRRRRHAACHHEADVALLPLTLALRDFSNAEKASGVLPKRLSEEGVATTDAGAVDDIAYYAPWKHLGAQPAGQVRVTISLAY
jgi:hypothetical protein